MIAKRVGPGVAALLALALVVPASSGAATLRSGFMSYVSEENTFGIDTAGLVLAGCPGARSASGLGGSVGGPAKTPFPYSAIAGLAAVDSVADADAVPDDAGILEAYNGSAKAIPVTSFVACIAPPVGGSDLSYEHQDYFNNPITSSVGSGMSVSCPGATTVGGGLLMNGDGSEEILRSSGFEVESDGRPDPTAWVASFNVNASMSSQHSASAQAICLAGTKLKLRHRIATRVMYQDQVRALRVACPRRGGNGWKVLSGGFLSPRVALVSAPFDNRDSGKAPEDGWRVKARSQSGQAPEVLVGFAVCGKRA